MLRNTQVTVTFGVKCKADEGETVCVVGSTEELGKWIPHKARVLKRQNKEDG